MKDKMITVVEMGEFIRFSKEYLSDEEKNDLIDYLASNPSAGSLIQETGGLRKLRWARKNQGKSGSYRVVYFFYNEDIPLFLIYGFAKNVMENISPAAKKQYAKLLKDLVKHYKGAK